MSEKIFVKIIGVLNASYWYNEKIGEVFEVTEHSRTDYKTVHSIENSAFGYLSKSDVVVISEIDHNINKLKREIEEKNKQIEELEKSKTKIKEEDIETGDVFRFRGGQGLQVTLIIDGYGNYKLGRIRENTFSLYVDAPRSTSQMVEYLNKMESVKVGKAETIIK